MKQLFKQLLMTITLFGMILIGSGCASKKLDDHYAWSDKTVVLNNVYANDIPKVSNSNLIVKVKMPKDNRGKTRNFIGYVRNGLFMHTADVYADKPVALWIQEVIISNLKKAGIKTETVKENNGNNDGIFLESQIDKLFCDVGFYFTADINLHIELNNKGSVVLNETYNGDAAKLNWWGHKSGFRITTEKAMKSCINKLMPELMRKIKKIEKNMPESNVRTSLSEIKNDKKITVKNKSGTTNKQKEIESQEENNLPDFLK